MGVPSLHGPRRPAQRHNAAGAAHWNVVQPAGGQPQMVGQADGGVRKQGEAGHAQAVHFVLAKAGAAQSAGKGAGQKPMGAADGMADVGHGHGRRDHHVLIGHAR